MTKKNHDRYPEMAKKLGSKYSKMHQSSEDYKQKEFGARGSGVPNPGTKKSVTDKGKADAVKGKFKLTKVDGKSVSPQRIKAKAVLSKMSTAKKKAAPKKARAMSPSEMKRAVVNQGNSIEAQIRESSLSAATKKQLIRQLRAK